MWSGKCFGVVSVLKSILLRSVLRRGSFAFWGGDD